MFYSNNHKKGFTLLEILIVIGIVTILAVTTLVILNPVEMLREARDTSRIQDIKNIDKAISVGRMQTPTLLDTIPINRVYLSLPDVNGNINDNCNVDYPTLPYLSSPWEYRCNASSTNLQKTDGTGWLPIDFNSIPGGGVSGVLPIDPNNTVNNNLYFTFSSNGSGTYSLSSTLESQKYLAQVANTDGGTATSSFETAPLAWTTNTIPGDWLDANWLYRKKITIDETKVDSTLTDFPVLVKLTSSNFDFSKAQSNGYDIRFTDSNGKILLSYERERHDNSGQIAEYWVRIPSVSGSINTEFYIYYGYASTGNGEDIANVWDSNHKAVWHKKDLTTASIKDSTSNNNTGNKVDINGPIELDGKIGKAQSYDGIDDYIDFGNGILNFDRYTPFTFSCWRKRLVDGGYSIIFGNFQESIPRGLLLAEYKPANRLYFNLSYHDTEGISVYSTDALPANNEYHLITYTYDGSGNASGVRIYINGISQTTVISRNNLAHSTTNTAARRMVRSSSSASYINSGIFDEVRISNAIRSPEWIKASYNSGNNTLLSFGSEETF